MNRRLLFLTLLITTLLFGCSPSESDIKTAIAQTEAAKPTNTFTPAPTDTSEPSPPPEDSLGVMKPSVPPIASDDTIRFTAIGCYGLASYPNAEEVSTLVHNWEPDFIITMGDNNYLSRPIDQNVGIYYHDFIYPYVGEYGEGADINRFFPSLGNHAWDVGDIQYYFDYFELPGNERYYDFVWGPVHFFALNSNEQEPDGITADSVQAQWLQERMTASTAPWQVVYFHHPPYSSDGNTHLATASDGSTYRSYGSRPDLQWPFAEWGADAVLTAHSHFYERLEADGVMYFINGLVLPRWFSDFGEPVPESQFRYNEIAGTQLITATECELTFEFYNIEDLENGGTLIDSYTINQCDAG